MNDRYLFRGKRVDNGEWIYGGFSEFVDHSFIVEVNSESQSMGSRAYILNEIEVIPETVGQCTGIKDKKGKLIFEGDIIKTVALNNDHNQKGATQILTVRNYMGNTCICFDGTESGIPLYPFNVIHTIEIIGNIHDEVKK